MKKEYFIDNISTETLAKLIDETLRFEKAQKSGGLKLNLLRIIPAAAAIVLVIGLVNLFPFMDSLNNMDENEPGTSSGNAIVLHESASNAADIEYETVTVTKQLGSLSITTLKGQEPIQNDDGTITLPGGGTYERRSSAGDKISVLSGVVLNRDGSIDVGLTANTGKKITIEDSNGDIIIIDEKGNITVNSKSIDDIVAEAVESALKSVDWSSFMDDFNQSEHHFGWDCCIKDFVNKDDLIYPNGFNWGDLRKSLIYPPDFDWDEFKDRLIIPELKEIYDEAVLVEKEYSNIYDISLDLIVDNVVVSRGGDSVKIKYNEWTKNEYTLSEDNGKLTLQYTADNKRFNDGKGSFTDDWVNRVLRLAGRKTSTRKIEITIPENATLESLIIDTTSGNINISDCSIKSINADTTSGNISIKNCANSQSYYADTTSGNVTFSGCNDAVKITADTTSGNVNITECNNIQTVIADTTSGHITFKNSVIKSASADVTVGKIKVQDCDIATLKVYGKTYNDVQNETFDAPDWSNYFENHILYNIADNSSKTKFITFDFYDGTKVTASNPIINSTNGQGDGYIIFVGTYCTIEFSNGVKIDAPINTKTEIWDGVFTATIGDGDATVTKPDSASFTVSSGTVLDNQGNVIKD